MKQFLIRLLSAMLLLTGCAPATVENSIRPSASRTSTAIPTTATPSPTPIPSTQTITLLPTIPTFTPTFDVSTIVTVTPAPPAACPRENSKVAGEFATPDSNGFYEIIVPEDVLTYLNSGGTFAHLAKSPPFSGEIKDLTGDGVSEVVLRGLVRYDILGCKDGKYQNLFQFFTYDFSIDLEDILDLNKDGIPELIFYSFSRYGYANVYIVGWDGNRFRSLIDIGVDTTTSAVLDSVSTTTYHKLMDTNGDGLKEIVLEDNPDTLEGVSGLTIWLLIPFRKDTISLGWNGKNFVVLNPQNYAPPQYRFQAIQDADRQARYGNYTGALSLYQEAVFNDRLEWWSPERQNYEVYVYNSQLDPERIVSPTPIPNNTEYQRLAAYAYYRIILLHIVQGHESDAGTVYKTLQQKFANDQHGRPYAEMATAFWEAYQSTHKMYDGCAASIQYAAENPEILVPLGSDYHGSQSHTYVPADVCPFR